MANQSGESEKDISPAVCSLVDTLWSEAVGELALLLAEPVERIKIDDITMAISKAEAVLLSLRKLLKKDNQSSSNEIQKLSDEFYSLIPHETEWIKTINSKRLVAEKHDLCQVCCLQEIW